VSNDPEAWEPVSRQIDPADDMCAGDASHYFRIGREAVELLRDAWEQHGAGEVRAILDLPSGFGRVARWLPAAFPGATITACDTHAPAVQFCQEPLGARGVVATLEGTHWPSLVGPFDLIWCGSLLTHFDEPRWESHLARCADRLAAHGLLVFSTHGDTVWRGMAQGRFDYGVSSEARRQMNAAVESTGFGYAGYPHVANYGVSVARPAWIRELLGRVPGLELRELSDAAWDERQDLVVCARSRT
jgi:SAM-dependent methyltransferase